MKMKRLFTLVLSLMMIGYDYTRKDGWSFSVSK